MTLARKAARLPSIARDGWRYPALRVRARGEQTAVEALRDLGFDETELRARFELVLGDARDTLRPRLAREAGVDVFFHDSLHTTRHMLFEFRVAWRHLRSGGVLVSDDVFWNPAFWLFTQVHRVPFRHIG